MTIKEWVSKNTLAVIIALLVINFFIISWGIINWGIYGMKNSTSLFRLDGLKSKQALLLEDSPDTQRTLASAGQTTATSSTNLQLTCSDDDLASAFAAVRPAIVNITSSNVSSTQRNQSLTSGITFDDPAIQFIQEQSLGSGIIVDSRGYIITNAHVASAAKNLLVITFSYERTAYAAEIILKDEAIDIAILKIYPQKPLPTAVLGDSDMIQVAERVLAIGSPFGLEQSVTAGIISDTSRDLVIDKITYFDMIQTDAAINRGNSGGALVNVKGEVIGIPTAIYAPTGVFAGVGFAIPANKAKPLIKKVVSSNLRL